VGLEKFGSWASWCVAGSASGNESIKSKTDDATSNSKCAFFSTVFYYGTNSEPIL
jgi:hypothetical protein